MTALASKPVVQAIRALAASIGIVLTVTAAFAADDGWSIRFSYDAFADKTAPMAIMGEMVEGISMDAGTVFLACDGPTLAVIFQDGGFNFDNTTAVKFRGTDGVEAFTFKTVDLPIFGRSRAVVGSDAAKIVAIFENAAAPVPYQTEKKSGKFPIIGFKQTKKIMMDYCTVS